MSKDAQINFHVVVGVVLVLVGAWLHSPALCLMLAGGTMLAMAVWKYRSMAG